MVRRGRDGVCVPLYVGEARDFRSRFLNHKKRAAALALGANEIHIHLLANSDADRVRIETDIRNGQPTPLNKQGNTLGALAGLFALPLR